MIVYLEGKGVEQLLLNNQLNRCRAFISLTRSIVEKPSVNIQCSRFWSYDYSRNRIL